MRKEIKNALTGALIKAVKVYKIAVSPYVIKSCRYHPSCSEYAVEALRKRGAIRGGAMALWRILRCNPFSSGGYDPVDRTITDKG